MDIRALLHILKGVQNDWEHSEYRHLGLCNAIHGSSHPSRFSMLQVFQLLSIQWPYYSGNPTFPITTGDTCPELQFHRVRKAVVFSLPKPPYYEQYIALRKDLLDFCIEKLEEELGLSPFTDTSGGVR